jgi:hypothetical protein
MLIRSGSTPDGAGQLLSAVLHALWNALAGVWHALMGVVLAEPGAWWKALLLVAALACVEWRVRYFLGGHVDTLRAPSDHGCGAWTLLTAPGVACHELGHALMTLLFFPLGYRVGRIVLFNPRPMRLKAGEGRPLAAVGYVTTWHPARTIPGVHDVVSVLICLAPLPFGLLVLSALYSVLTGHAPWQPGGLNLGAHPWWADALLIYLLLCVVAHCWPSSADLLNTRPHLPGLAGTLLVAGICGYLLGVFGGHWALFSHNTARFEVNVAAAIVFMTAVEYLLLLLVRRGWRV